MEYVSAEEAWESFKSEYFKGVEDLAEGFADDNPLAGSASFTIFLNDIGDQDQVVSRLQLIDGVRKVNYSNSAVAGLSSTAKIVGLLSAVIIGVLLAVALVLFAVLRLRPPGGGAGQGGEGRVPPGRHPPL